MLDILRESPVESGGLTIWFDRSPDIFLMPVLKSEYFDCVGFFRGEELVGFAMLLYFEAFVNSKPEIVTYFCNMYIKKEFRGKGFYYRASDFLFRETYKNAKLGYTIIMKGNRAAESYIGRTHPRFPSLPFSKIISYLEVKNILITFRKKESRDYIIRQAQKTDIDTIVDLLQKEFSKRLFAPVINRQKFDKGLADRPEFDISNYYLAEKGNEIVGVCAAWDTNSIRQNRILKYSRPMKWTRIMYSLIAALFRLPGLPRKGDPFKDVTITEYAVKDRNPEIMKALLRRINNDFRIKGYNIIIFGSCSNDPLLRSAKSFYHRTVASNIVLASTEKSFIEEDLLNKNLPYVDMMTL